MDKLFQDLRFGARMLRKAPGFTFVAVITLALGIGANTAIFSVTSALLLRPLPYRDSGRLLLLATHRREEPGNFGPFSLNRYELVRDRNQSFESVAAFSNDSFNITGRGEPLQVPAARVTPNFFDTLGLVPALGRGFVPDDGKPEGRPVVIIGDSLWHTRFSGDPGVVGETVNIEGIPQTIIGVLPPGFSFASIGPADIWSPRYFELTLMTPARIRSGVGYLTGIARLKPGVSPKAAASEMEVLNQRYRQEFPKAPDADPAIAIATPSLQESVVANIRTGLLVLSTAVAVVMLIACGNVASLLLSRALGRRREIAVRAALGASRSAVTRQLLSESALLALLAATPGLAIGYAGTVFLGRLGHESLPPGTSLSIDMRVLAFVVALTTATGFIFGIFPALQLARTDVNSTLREEGSATSGRKRLQLNNALVAGQVALSIVLLVCAGLLLLSFSRLLHVDPGFDPRGMLTMNISLPTVKYAKPDQQIAFFRDLVQRVKALPGVQSAAVSAALPLTPRRITPVLPEGRPEVPLAERPLIVIEAIGPEYFATMRVPLKAGRVFTDADDANAPRVIVANEALAKRYWPGENPVGKHVLIGRKTQGAEVVGVTANVKNNGLALDAQPQLYLPFPQLPWGNMNLFVRGAIDPEALAPEVRAQIAAMDPDQPVTGVQTLDELLAGSRSQARFTMLLLSAFSGCALLLAAIGIYGALARSVAQRTKEMGIRLALGASRAAVRSMVLKQGLLLCGIGSVIGLAVALACSRLLSSLLYQVSARDVAVFTASPLLLITVGLLASYLPAQRATKADPIRSLRQT